MKQKFMLYSDVKNELESSKNLLDLQMYNSIYQLKEIEIIEKILKTMKPEDSLPLTKNEFYKYVFYSHLVDDLKIKNQFEQINYKRPHTKILPDYIDFANCYKNQKYGYGDFLTEKYLSLVKEKYKGEK